MKIFGILIALTFLVVACGKEEIIVQQDPAIVNIASEDKGDPITFSSANNSTYYTSTDTFIIISGGVPPYIIESSDIGTSYIKNDTLFFLNRVFSTPQLYKINIIDNRGYNRAQFSFISSPRVINLEIDNQGTDLIVNASRSNPAQSYNYLYDSPTIIYYPENDSLSFNEVALSRLVFGQKGQKSGNKLVSFVSFIDNSGFTPFIGSYNNEGANNTVNLEYNLLGVPKSIEFLFVLKETNNLAPNFTLQTTQKYKLRIQ